MAMTFDALKKLLDALSLQYYVHPQLPTAMLGFQGRQANFRLTISLQSDGTFLQFRVMGYATCPLNSPHLPALLRLLSDLNHELRWVKFSVDPQDGEVGVTGDTWIADGAVTQRQIDRMLGNLLPCIDDALPRISQVIQTGVDPGEKPQSPARPAGVVESL